MDEPLRAGVIGVGFMGELHARLYSELPGVSLRAVADVDEERAAEVGGAHGARETYTDYRELLADDAVDLVSVGSPEQLHREHAVAALEADKHLLLEKPMAHRLEDAKAIREAAQSSDRTFMIGYVLRFDPRYVEGRNRVLDVGQDSIISLYARRRNPISSPRRVAGWSHPMFYMAVHDLDMMRWYTGSEAREVYAVAASKALDEDVPDVIMSTLRFGNGAVGQVETNWVLPDRIGTGLESRFEVTSVGQFTRVNILDQGLLNVSEEEGYAYPDALHWPELHGRIEGDLRRELEHFLSCVRGEDEPLATAEDGYRSLEIARGLMRSIDRGEPVSLQ